MEFIYLFFKKNIYIYINSMFEFELLFCCFNIFFWTTNMFWGEFLSMFRMVLSGFVLVGFWSVFVS